MLPNLLPSFQPHNRILVCEGKFDAMFINNVISEFTPRIFVIPAGGKDNVPKVRGFFNEYNAIYIQDRDFDLSPKAAQTTYEPGKVRTVWQRHDIEGYLLHTEWIHTAFEQIAHSPKGKRLDHDTPADQREVEIAIVEVAQSLVAEYAARQTLHDLRRSLGSLRNAIQIPDPSADARPTASSEWHSYILEVVENLKEESVKIETLPDLSNDSLTEKLHETLANYRNWAKNIETIRVYFSGKAILKHLASKWFQGSYENDRLSKEVVRVAIEHARKLKADNQKLRDDAYLRDFALIAEKSLSDNTQL